MSDFAALLVRVLLEGWRHFGNDSITDPDRFRVEDVESEGSSNGEAGGEERRSSPEPAG